MAKKPTSASKVAEDVVSAPVTWWDRFWRVVSSGLFFMVVGSVFLWIANHTMGDAHSSFSFVLVVVGVAILLYGTGTQGMGQFSTSTGSAKYKVAIAGGAGVLAFCVAIGILHYAPQMKDAFQIEKRYARILIEPDNKDSIGASVFANYLAEVSINGEVVPVLRRTQIVEVYVPYFANKPRDTNLLVSFYHMHPDKATSVEKTSERRTYPVVIEDGKLDRSDGSLDFPTYNKTLTIQLQKEESIRDQNQRIGNQTGNPDPPQFPTDK